MQAGPPSTFSIPVATPLVGSPFDIHASAGRSAQWSLDPSRRFESKRASKAGSGDGSVAAKWHVPGKAKRSQAFAWTGPSIGTNRRATGWSGHFMDEHPCKILKLPIFWPTAQPNAIL